MINEFKIPFRAIYTEALIKYHLIQFQYCNHLYNAKCYVLYLTNIIQKSLYIHKRQDSFKYLQFHKYTM